MFQTIPLIPFLVGGLVVATLTLAILGVVFLLGILGRQNELEQSLKNQDARIDHWYNEHLKLEEATFRKFAQRSPLELFQMTPLQSVWEGRSATEREVDQACENHERLDQRMRERADARRREKIEAEAKQGYAEQLKQHANLSQHSAAVSEARRQSLHSERNQPADCASNGESK